ncbi:MAG: hypothetical protein EPN82_10020 [Bacteroidetes bacterium]|nr:MAG: hypothetical protein EPN82_10020 [Bacteroidota bacterium]
MKQLCIFILCLIIISCNDTTNPNDNIIKTTGNYIKIKEDQSNDVLLPLKKGNFWVYKFVYDTTDINTIMYGYDTLTVTGDTLFSGENFFILSNANCVSPVCMDYKIFLTNTNNGVWFHDLFTYNLNYLEVKYPANNNEIYYSEAYKWLFHSHDTSYNYLKAERQLKIETNQYLTVEAGNFNCYKFIESYNNFKLYDLGNDTLTYYQSIYYYALNVGKVKEEIYHITYFKGRETKKEKLLTYTLKEYKLY